MNTYVKVQQAETQEHFIVSLHFSEDQLRLVRNRGFKRPIIENLQKSKIKHLLINEMLGCPIVSLSGSSLYILSIRSCCHRIFKGKFSCLN